VSTGSYLPGEKPVTNQMLSTVFGETVNLIGDYFGVQSRHFVVNYQTGENISKESNSDFCYKASEKALRKINMDAQDIDMIISATNTPDFTLPQSSVLIQEKLGIKKVLTLDIRGGCAVPLQGLLIAQTFIQSKMVRNVLIVGGECFSNIYYPYLLKHKKNFLAKDLMNSLIFGDGAAAIIASEEKTSDESLLVEYIDSSSSYPTWHPGFIVALGGSKVYHLGESNISLGRMIQHFPKEIMSNLPKVIKNALEKLGAEKGYSKEQFKYIIGPQANKRLVDTLNQEFHSTNYFYNGDIVGNVPAAALLLALDSLLKDRELKKSDKILILGIESAKWIYGQCVLHKV
jgi:3-oxoacyl-[acyl-carrier-protein] synthase-3